MFSNQRVLTTVLLAFMALAGTGSVQASESSDDVHVLTSSPACILKRLGQVSISVGDANPDLRSGGLPKAVKYDHAFAKLAQAAADKGGNAVVLRDHQASFLQRGSRRTLRPNHIALKGAVLEIDASNAQCELAVVDVASFEKSAMAAQRDNLTKDTGVSF